MLDAAVHVVVRDEVIVVDHQDDVVATFGDLVHHAADRRIETVADRRSHGLGETRHRVGERGGHVGPEP